MARIEILYEGNLSTRSVFPETGKELLTDARLRTTGRGRFHQISSAWRWVPVF